MVDRIIELDIRIRGIVRLRKAKIAEDTDEEVNRKAHEMLLCQHFVHSSESCLFEFLEALQEVDLSGEAEDEDWKCVETARKLHVADVLILNVVVAD